MIKVQVLGCGTSSGVPTILGEWGDCDPNEPKNRRTRASIMLDFNGYTLLVDTGADLREQLLAADWDKIDGVFYTHDHADHTHGIDDLRFIVWKQNQGSMPVYSTSDYLERLEQKFNYIFEGFGIYQPFLKAVAFDETQGGFELAGQWIETFRQPHGRMLTHGMRLGDFAYCTDCVDFTEQQFSKLENLDVLLVDAVRIEPHKTHAHLDMVLEWVERLKPRMTYLTHMNPDMDYARLCQNLPDHVRPAYDGLKIEVG